MGVTVPAGATARVTRPGPNGPVTLSARVWALLDDAYRSVGLDPARYLQVAQGSWSTSVGASGSTHAGGGAFDLRTTVLPPSKVAPLVDALRVRGVCAWKRDATHGGMAPHVHGIDRNEPGLSSGARSQVTSYDRSRNGLSGASEGPDYHPRPRQVGFTYREDDDDMPTAAEIAEAVWAAKVEDPVTREQVSARELLRRTRTVATQARDNTRELGGTRSADG